MTKMTDKTKVTTYQLDVDEVEDILRDYYWRKFRGETRQDIDGVVFKWDEDYGVDISIVHREKEDVV